MSPVQKLESAIFGQRNSCRHLMVRRDVQKLSAGTPQISGHNSTMIHCDWLQNATIYSGSSANAWKARILYQNRVSWIDQQARKDIRCQLSARKNTDLILV